MSETPEQPQVFSGNMDDLFSDFVETEEAPTEPVTEAPEAEGQPEPVAEQEPAQQLEEEAPETPEGEAPEPVEAPEEPQLIGGKFKSQEDLLASYQRAEALATQRAQEAAESKRRADQITHALRQAEPLLRQAAAMQQQPQDLDELDTTDPQVIQQLIDQRAAALVQEQTAPLIEAQQRQRYEQGMREIETYRAEHPDAVAFEADVKSIVDEYRYDEGEEVFPPTKDNLETALTLAQNPQAHSLLQSLNLHPEKEWVQHAVEVTSNPSLQSVVLAHPHVIESEAGMSWARQQAGLPTVVQQAKENAQVAKTHAQTAERKAAHVETGEGSEGDLAPGRKPQDPLEEAFQEAMANDAKGAIFR